MRELKQQYSHVLHQELQKAHDDLVCWHGGTRKKGVLWSHKKFNETSTLDDIRKVGEDSVSKCFGEKITAAAKTVARVRKSLLNHLGLTQEQWEGKSEYAIVRETRKALNRAISTEFECRMWGLWDAVGAARVKQFDKICAKFHADVGENLKDCQSIVVPQLLNMAYTAAERDQHGQKRKRSTANIAPATPTLPEGVVTSNEPPKKKQKKEKEAVVQKTKKSEKEADIASKKKNKKKNKGKKEKRKSSSSDDSSSD